MSDSGIWNQHSPSPGISKIFFCAVHITGDIKNFIKILISKNQNCRNLNEIFHISVDIESIKKLDQILEMPGPGVFLSSLEFYF